VGADRLPLKRYFEVAAEGILADGAQRKRFVFVACSRNWPIDQLHKMKQKRGFDSVLLRLLRAAVGGEEGENHPDDRELKPTPH
jgi:hypothetical protein